MLSSMGKLSQTYLFLSVALALACGCGCIDSIIGKSEPEMPPMTAEWVDGPRIRPGVMMVIQVGTVSQPPTTMQLQVDQKGELTLPYLLQEPVMCNGLSLEALKEKLVKCYQVYIKQPQVSVTFAPYDGKGVSPWGTVTVLGEVVMPGPVNMPPTMDLTVTKVLQAAGGLRPFANKSKIQVSRCDRDGKITKYTIDLIEIGEKGRIEKDLSLRAGDVVWVPETWY